MYFPTIASAKAATTARRGRAGTHLVHERERGKAPNDVDQDHKEDEAPSPARVRAVLAKIRIRLDELERDERGIEPGPTDKGPRANCDKFSGFLMRTRTGADPNSRLKSTDMGRGHRVRENVDGVEEVRWGWSSAFSTRLHLGRACTPERCASTYAAARDRADEERTPPRRELGYLAPLGVRAPLARRTSSVPTVSPSHSVISITRASYCSPPHAPRRLGGVGRLHLGHRWNVTKLAFTAGRRCTKWRTNERRNSGTQGAGGARACCFSGPECR